MCARTPLVAGLRRNAFKRALINLTGNSARYASIIQIRALRSRGWLTIAIEDNGPGIPADKREEVFRPFHSLDKARNQNKKSSGLASPSPAISCAAMAARSRSATACSAG